MTSEEFTNIRTELRRLSMDGPNQIRNNVTCAIWDINADALLGKPLSRLKKVIIRNRLIALAYWYERYKMNGSQKDCDETMLAIALLKNYAKIMGYNPEIPDLENI